MTVADVRELRSTPFRELNREYWSQGQPALDTERVKVRPRHESHKDPANMTLEELIATQSQEIPSISYLAYCETGAGVKSLDGYKTDKRDQEPKVGTLADTVADDHWLREVYPEAFADDADPEVAAHVYDLWLDDEHMARRYGKGGKAQGVPVPPEIADRIEWEQYVAQCSEVTREGLRFDPETGAMSFFSLVGRRLTGAEFQEHKAAFLAAFMKRIGRDSMPTKTEFRQKHALYKNPQFRRELDRIARMRDQVDAALLALDNERANALDSDAETSAAEIDYPYIPSLSVFIYRACEANRATEPEFGTREWRKWKDERVLEATREYAAWCADHLDAPAPRVRFRSVSQAQDWFNALWHQVGWVQAGANDYVHKRKNHRIALGNHPAQEQA